jgi:hypothetical protein
MVIFLSPTNLPTQNRSAKGCTGINWEIQTQIEPSGWRSKKGDRGLEDCTCPAGFGETRCELKMELSKLSEKMDGKTVCNTDPCLPRPRISLQAWPALFLVHPVGCLTQTLANARQLSPQASCPLVFVGRFKPPMTEPVAQSSWERTPWRHPCCNDTFLPRPGPLRPLH